ncbi:MAG: DNA repair protein RecO [Deltaproteobacteria bacterium]|nr:DNA repair protein RecO [Deltaproteobacteria bacterium]
MRPSLTTAAIVLRARLFGESDKIVTFLTEDHGKITGIAKGAKNSRRRFVNSLEPFAQVRLHFEDRPAGKLVFLLSAELQLAYKQLSQDLDRIAYAAYLIEITDGLIGEREENRRLFEHLRAGLCHLEESGPSLRFVSSYELKLLRLAGYQPILDHCKSCAAQDFTESQWYFSLMEGGVLCAACCGARKELVPLGASAVKMLTQLQDENALAAEPVVLPARVVHEIRRTLSGFLQHHIDHEIKSAPFLRGYFAV